MLPPESRIDRHEQHHVKVRQNVIKGAKRSGRIKRYCCLDLPALYIINSPVKMDASLDMYCEVIGAGSDKIIQKTVRGLYHQVDIKRQRSRFPDCFNNDRTYCHIGHK